jgi:uncharacterized membrane protein YidH (DUF202 family)
VEPARDRNSAHPPRLVVVIVSYLEWMTNQRALRRGEPVGRSRLPWVMTVTIAAVGLIAVALSLLSGVTQHR